MNDSLSTLLLSLEAVFGINLKLLARRSQLGDFARLLVSGSALIIVIVLLLNHIRLMNFGSIPRRG